MNITTPSSSSSPVIPLEFLDPREFLWSFYACMFGFLVVACRAVVWSGRYCEYHRVNARAYLSQKRDPPSYAPLFLSLLLSVVLALRAAWSFVKYLVLTNNSEMHVSPQVMALLDHLPLLFLLSAFSRISLFWVRSFGMEKTNRVSWIVFTSNLFLYIGFAGQLILSLWYPNLLQPHNIYYIVQLCAVALWCLILSTLFSVYGWHLRARLAQSMHSSQQVRDTFNRILAATICCTVLFFMRGALFCVLTIRFNVDDKLDPALNHIVYPLLVYTVPDVVSSICILFIMDVKRDDRAKMVLGGEGYRHTLSSGNSRHDMNDATRPNFGGVGSIVDRSGYSGGYSNNSHHHSPGEGEAAFLDEQSPTDSFGSSLKYDWAVSQGYSPPGTWESTRPHNGDTPTRNF